MVGLMVVEVVDESDVETGKDSEWVQKSDVADDEDWRDGLK